jgi:LacI family transcriptional regulator, galactose operon repressor
MPRSRVAGVQDGAPKPEGEPVLPAATLRDVAALAGVDRSTASRVLRDDPVQSVREDTRERIFEAARRLRYRPNAIAASLRTRSTQTLAFVIPDLDNIGFTAIARGVQTAASAAGYLVLLAEASPDEDRALFERLTAERRIDGLLVANAGVQLARELPSGVPAVPTVFVNRAIKGAAASVTVDDRRGAEMAIEHLVELGHENIGFIAGRPDADTSRRRRQGVRSALKTAGLELRDAWVASGDYTERGGAEAARAILAAKRPYPTAIFAANLVSGLGALRVFIEAGINVPADLSLIVMDAHPLAAHTGPPLTTVEMPLYAMGVAAAEMLIGAIRGGPLEHRVIRDEPRIVVRESTTSPAR